MVEELKYWQKRYVLLGKQLDLVEDILLIEALILEQNSINSRIKYMRERLGVTC